MDALLAPLERLHEDYTAAARALDAIIEDVEDLRSRLLARPQTGGRQPRPIQDTGGWTPTATEPEPENTPSAHVQVRSEDLGRLLEFQEQLSHIAGVRRVSVSMLGPEEAALLVELHSEAIPDTGDDRSGDAASTKGDEPTVICARCGKLLSRGGPQVSHGLCADCAIPFIRGTD